jgi:hypothetical protein
MKILFDEYSNEREEIKNIVLEFLSQISTLESQHGVPVTIFQDGVSGSYYIKCSILARDAEKRCDLDARLDVTKPDSLRANRNLLLQNNTYLKMKEDALNGREFNDIIVEFSSLYNPTKPLKVWGGQHRINAISEVAKKINRYHGFRIYFNLSKEQRTEVALISNTNMTVSNDTFDRMIEETIFGDTLRKWCQFVGFLSNDEDFPDVGSHSEKITVKKARSFIINYYMGLELGKRLNQNELDLKVYEPYLATTGVVIDKEYEKIMRNYEIISDQSLLISGQRFLCLNNAQIRGIKENSKITNRKAYRLKAMVESVLCGWSYISGLLQNHPERLENHYRVPKINSKVLDPLNAEEMSQYKHDSDSPTYRGLGTRSSAKDRQRMAHLFLAKSSQENVLIDKNFITRAINTLTGLIYGSKGYL